MRGKATLLRMYSEIAKTTISQIISPTLGVISHDWLAARIEMLMRTSVRLKRTLKEEGNEAADEAVEERRLGQREAEPLDLA